MIEGLLEPGSHVDALDRPLVEVDVALHGTDDLADPSDRQAHLVQQLVGRRAGRQPGEHVGRQLAQGRCGPPGLDERRRPVRIVGERGHLVDAVGAVERRSWRVHALRRARRVIRMRQLLGRIDRLAKAAYGTGGGGGRIVELVGQAGGEGSERGQLLALTERRLHLPQPQDGGADDGERHIGARVEELAHGADRDPQHLGVGCSLDRGKAPAALKGRDLALQRARPDAGEGDLAGPRQLRHVELTVQDDEQRIGLLSLSDKPGPGRQVDDLPHLDQPFELLVAEAAEQRRGPELLDDRLRCQVLVIVAHRSARYWCANWIAIAPSPTALAMRFTDS